jgi:Ca-activated chloride channel family protein
MLYHRVLKNFSFISIYIKALLWVVTIFFLCLVLLRPQWDKKEEEVAQEGRDLLIALDISRSMLGQDLHPNRLDFAKEKIKKLLHNLSCERVGLIIFSGATVVQCPLTTDYAAFFMFLDQLDADTISSGSTAIDQAISKSISIFERMPSKKTKLLFAFTDGEDFSRNLADVKTKAAQQGISIFTIGVGTVHGAPVPIVKSDGVIDGFEKDSQGHVVMSRLNEGILQNIAQQCGGKYIRVTQSDDDIKMLIHAVQSFEKDKFQDKKVNGLQEQYPYFVAVAWLALLLEWLL